MMAPSSKIHKLLWNSQQNELGSIPSVQNIPRICNVSNIILWCGNWYLLSATHVCLLCWELHISDGYKNGLQRPHIRTVYTKAFLFACNVLNKMCLITVIYASNLNIAQSIFTSESDFPFLQELFNYFSHFNCIYVRCKLIMQTQFIPLESGILWCFSVAIIFDLLRQGL